MALRILVADHSESISKAIHLSLKDFAVKMQSFIPDDASQVRDKSLSLEENILEIVSSFKPSLIFLDTLLSKVNGYEVAKTLKADERFKSVPIILMYSSIIGIDQEKFQNSEADDILEKPFTQKRLRSLVTKCLDLEDSPLAELGEEMQLPAIEDLDQDILSDIKDLPQQGSPSQNSMPIQDATSQNVIVLPQKQHPNKGPIEKSTDLSTETKNQQPEGLINSDVELKELQKSLSELDGEEDFKKVELFSSDTLKSSQKADPPPSQASPSKDTLDFSDIGLEDVRLINSQESKKKDVPQIEKAPEPISSYSTKSTTTSPKNIKAVSPNIYKKKQDTKTSPDTSHTLKLKTTDTSNIKKDIPSKPPAKVLDIQKSSSSQDTLNINKSSTKKPSKVIPDAFKVDISTEDAIKDETTINFIEPQEEEEMTPISFPLPPEITGDSKEQKSYPSAMYSKEEIAQLVQEEVRKIAQNQIQRILNKELPQMAKKQIKEEISRLLSEYDSNKNSSN